MGEAYLERLFWTPVIIDRVNDGEALADALELLILERMRGHPTVEGRSNLGGWHSDYRLLEWGGEPMRRLRDHTVEIANAHCNDVRESAVWPPEWHCVAWANVLGKGDMNMPHAHGDSYWSAVFFVRTEAGLGGELLLHDPRRPAIEMHAPHLKFDPNGGERLVHIPPEKGMLVLMPSWLTHSVRRWEGDGVRISVAINLAAPTARS